MGTLKAEMLQNGRFINAADARSELFAYIDSYYNTQRLHSSLSYQSPASFEADLALAKLDSSFLVQISVASQRARTHRHPPQARQHLELCQPPSHPVPAPHPGPTRPAPSKAISPPINWVETQSSSGSCPSPPSALPSPSSSFGFSENLPGSWNVESLQPGTIHKSAHIRER